MSVRRPDPPKPKPKPKTGSPGAGTPKTPPRTPTPSGNGAGYPQQPKTTPSAGRGIGEYGSADTLERQQQWAYDALPPTYDDPYNGLTPAEIFLLGLNDNSNKPGGGSGRGSSAAPAVSQETINAYNQMLQALQAQSGAEMGAYDQRASSLDTLRGEGDARLRAIMAQLDASRTSAQGASNQAFSQADQRIAQMADQYAQGAAGRDAGMNRSLNAFGVESLGGQSGGSLQDMMGAVRATNSALQGVSDQSYVNRANVHAGLNADASHQYNQAFTQLQAQLQAQRQQAAIADAQRRAQLAIQAAQAGVALPQGA